jgi:hypothetical protein
MVASFENGAAGCFPYLMETPGGAFARDQSLCGNKNGVNRTQLWCRSVFTKKKRIKVSIINFWLLPCGKNVAE